MKASRIVQALSRKVSAKSRGDAARNEQDWPEAERSYKQHLDAHPDDFDIWVQYGHSVKEQGKLDDAELAYRRAVTLRPDDQDAQNQLGHLLKRAARPDEAAAVFEDLLRQTGSQEAYSELRGLRSSEQANDVLGEVAGPELDADVLLIELDDMLGYLEAHKTLSGIQRVQTGVINHVLTSQQGAAGQRYVFVLNPLDEERLWRLRNEDLAAIVNYVTSARVDHAKLKALVAIARRNAVTTLPKKGQSYLILGAFWGYGGVAARYSYLKRAGVTLGVYVYDLIPINNAEYCDEGLPHEFALSFGDGMQIFDYILTISEFTASEVRRYIEGFELDPRPVIAVPLAHASSDTMKRTPAIWTAAIKELRDRPFVLMVSTIEARKNHAYLVAAWKAFLDEGLDPPDLVFVGRVGWRVTSLMEMLETTGYYDNRIHILHDLSDAELNTLYGACLFTAFPSFVEGWGLPVGESLAHGKPCVASSTSSISEVGGKLVDYVDPMNLRGGIEVLRRMTFDQAYRERRTEEIGRNFRPRTWQRVGTELIERAEEARKRVKVSRLAAPYLGPGVLFRPSALALGRKLPKDYARSPSRLMLAKSWYGVEQLGCWMRGNDASLEFRTGLAVGTEILLYLQFYGAGHRLTMPEHALTVTLAGRTLPGSSRDTSVTTRVPEVGRVSVRMRGEVGAEGLVTLRLVLKGDVRAEDAKDQSSRRFAVGLAALGYAPANDLASRLEISEQVGFQLLDPVRAETRDRASAHPGPTAETDRSLVPEDGTSPAGRSALGESAEDV